MKIETWECDACGKQAAARVAQATGWIVVTVTRHEPYATKEFHACSAEHMSVGVAKRSTELEHAG